MPFDFDSSLKEAKHFIACDWVRELNEFVVDGEVITSPRFMTADQLRQTIIEDIIMVTIWELQTEQTVVYDHEEMLRFIPEDLKRQVLLEFNHGDVQRFVIVSPQGEIRIRQVQLQAAMNYAGVYYSGYEMPEGVLHLNRDALEDAVEEHGGLFPLVKALCMDLDATSSGTKTLN